MDININRSGQVEIMELKGRLDSNTSKDLDEAFSKLFINGVYNILLDLSGLEYISSAGLRILLMAVKTINKNEGRLALCSMNEFVKEIFEIAGFTPLFQVYSDREEAMQIAFSQ